MKKLLGIIVLGLLLSGNAYADNYKIQNPDRYCPSLILPNDVASIKKSNVCLADKTAFKEYGFQVVDKKD